MITYNCKGVVMIMNIQYHRSYRIMEPTAFSDLKKYFSLRGGGGILRLGGKDKVQKRSLKTWSIFLTFVSPPPHPDFWMKNFPYRRTFFAGVVSK